MLRGNKLLCAKCGLKAQHGCHAHKSSPESVGRFSRNLVCSIWVSSPFKFVQMMALGWPSPILWQGQFWKHSLVGNILRCPQ